MTTFIESSVGGMAKTSRNVFRTKLISAGQGSSGFYSAETLKEFVPVALPKGTKVYFDHMTEEEMDSGRARKMDKLVGVFEDDPVFDDGEEASYANIRIYENSPTFKNVPEFIAEALKDIGVSIEVHKGVKDENDNVLELGHSPHNSLAIVTTPGARGRIEGLMESFRSTENSNTDKARNTMDKAEMLEVLKAHDEARLPVLIEALTKVLTPAVEDKADEPSLETLSEAVATAGLTAEGRKAVYAQVGAGVAVEAAVQAEKDREIAILESLKETVESGGFRVQESGKTDDYNAQYEAGIK